MAWVDYQRSHLPSGAICRIAAAVGLVICVLSGCAEQSGQSSTNRQNDQYTGFLVLPSRVDDTVTLHFVDRGQYVRKIGGFYDVRFLLDDTVYIKRTEDAPWIHIDRVGDQVDDDGYLRTTGYFGGVAAYAVATPEDRWVLLDRSGARIGTDDYAEVRQMHPSQPLTDYDPGLIAVRHGDTWQYVDAQGAVAIAGPFADCQSFAGGMAGVAVRVEGIESQDQDDSRLVWGFISGDGSWQIQPEYDFVTPFFRSGLAMVRKDGDFFYIDRSGKRFLGGVASEWGVLGIMSEGLVAVRSRRRTGYMDISGVYVIPPRFEGGTDYFLDGVAVARDSVSGKSGLIDRRGEWVVAARYDDLRRIHGAPGIFQFSERGRTGFMMANEEVIYAE